MHRHQQLDADLIELNFTPDLPYFILTKAAIQDTPNSNAGVALIPLQSAEGQKQRQGRHQG